MRDRSLPGWLVSKGIEYRQGLAAIGEQAVSSSVTSQAVTTSVTTEKVASAVATEKAVRTSLVRI